MDNDNLEIGDLVMCKAKIDPLEKSTPQNIKLVIGWITAKDLNGYYIHWSDKDYAGFVNPDSAYLTRKFFLKKRKDIGL